MPLIPTAFLGASPLAGRSLQFPSWEELWQVLSLQEYNTRIVVLGTMMLGIASGVVGSFLLLRKRSLLSDTISHATLPGIVMAFLVMAMVGGGDGRHFLGLMAGAAMTGLVGMVAVLAIRNYTRLKDDAALGIVLSAFFALGIGLLAIASRTGHGNAAGLESFIYGKTASMLRTDALMMGGVALVAIASCLVLFKEFKMLCFDQGFAATQGWPTYALDFLIMGQVVLVTVVGLQAVGLILVVAMLVIPPAAARFWTHRLSSMILVAALVGGASGYLGSGISALVARLPAGAIIVLTGAVLFVISLLVGKERGLIVRAVRHYKLTRQVERQHLLRALYELAEQEDRATQPSLASQPFKRLLLERSWSSPKLRKILRRAQRKGLVQQTEPGRYALTAEGTIQALRVVRNHRLWEIYLIHHADTAAAVVDRAAERIEHVLTDDMVQRLERLAADRLGGSLLPPSPH